MALITCPECGAGVSDQAYSCTHCGNPIRSVPAPTSQWRGYQWRSQAEILGWPLVHIAVGCDRQTGRFLVAKGIIAIGQFGIGLITFAQFGIGFLFAFGQFTGGLLAIGQLAVGVYFGLGQFATGATVIGQVAFGKYVLAQMGFGEHVWSTETKDPQAVEYFENLWESVKAFLRM